MEGRYHTHIREKNASDVGNAMDVLLKIAEYASFAWITPGMVVQARKNTVYVGDALNYKRIHTQCQLYYKIKV